MTREITITVSLDLDGLEPDNIEGTREALAMATERVNELNRQLKAHHDHDGDLRRELNGMHYRERQVDKVVAAWDNQRGNLKGYDGTIDPETPAGRVVELLRDLCRVRPTTTQVLEGRGAALDTIEANLRKYGIGLGEGDYPDILVMAVSVALRDRADALQQLRTIDNALTMHTDGRDPMTMALKHPADTAARVAEALSLAGRAAADITKAADTAEQAAAVTDADGEVDAVAAEMFIAGLRAAAQIAAGETPEVDPHVAHIDTVNGRGTHAQRPGDLSRHTTSSTSAGRRSVDLQETE